VEKTCEEQRASKEYIALIWKYSLRVKRREMGIPVNSDVPIPNRPVPKNLLKRIFNN